MELLGPFFPVFFAAMWVAISSLLSRMGGWSSLGEHYRNASDFSGKKWRMQSIGVGMVNYGSCVTLGADFSRLFMGVMFIFRIGHPNLEIPLVDVSGEEVKGFLFRYVDLSLARCPHIRIRLSKKQAARIEVEAQGCWQFRRITSHQS